jgi:hypothetical protein
MADPGRHPANGRESTSASFSEWGALSHQLIGQLALIEWQLNLDLALFIARDAWSVPSALRLVERLPIGDRTKLLDEIDRPDDGLPQTTAAWLRELSAVRNELAHSWIVSATRDSATYRSFFRGRHRPFSLSRDEMANLQRKALRVHVNLTWLETLVGNPDVWAATMGFSERD